MTGPHNADSVQKITKVMTGPHNADSLQSITKLWQDHTMMTVFRTLQKL